MIEYTAEEYVGEVKIFAASKKYFKYIQRISTCFQPFIVGVAILWTLHLALEQPQHMVGCVPFSLVINEMDVQRRRMIYLFLVFILTVTLSKNK